MNPQRACAGRVTVVGLSVCVCVCVDAYSGTTGYIYRVEIERSSSRCFCTCNNNTVLIIPCRCGDHSACMCMYERYTAAGSVWSVAKYTKCQRVHVPKVYTLVLFIVLQLHASVFQGERLQSDSGGTDMYDHITADNDRLAGHWQ